MDIKEAFGSLANKAKSGTNIIVTETKKLSNEAVKRSEMSTIESKLNYAYCELGKVVYANVNGTEQTRKDVKPYLDKIRELMNSYEKIKKEFEEADKNFEKEIEEHKKTMYVPKD